MIHSLSKESKEFLENLTLYLVASGKKENEINEIVDELEDHLQIAESRGKNVTQIVGNSPEVYMQQIANEMPIGKKQLIGYVLLIVLGVVSYDIILSTIAGGISYSVLKIIGTMGIVSLFIFLMDIIFKKVAMKKMTTTLELFSYTLLGVVPIALFVALIYADRVFSTRVIEFSGVGAWILAGMASLFLIGVSVWAKTPVVIISLILLVTPKIIFNFYTVESNVELITSSIVPFGGMAIYLLFLNKKKKQ